MGETGGVSLSPGLADAAAQLMIASGAPAPGSPLRRVFAGEERQLGLMRRWLASLLPACSVRDDVAGIATELGSNAIRHSASGRGGTFAVEITLSASIVRVAVVDGGGQTEPRVIHDAAAEDGRGLLLVRGLSDRMGVAGDHGGRTVWAEVTWDAPDGEA
jgi:serine/threonine-protein kinase RsbW